MWHFGKSGWLWLVLTLIIYQLADWLFKRTGSIPLLNPVLPSGILLVGLLLATITAYQKNLDWRHHLFSRYQRPASSGMLA
ncbi:MAG: hypothetical protein GWP61_01165 [Chloroflexi bacterium]|nr:hypothetical protein [Chloroflexota bacterium]